MLKVGGETINNIFWKNRKTQILVISLHQAVLGSEILRPSQLKYNSSLWRHIISHNHLYWVWSFWTWSTRNAKISSPSQFHQESWIWQNRRLVNCHTPGCLGQVTVTCLEPGKVTYWQPTRQKGFCKCKEVVFSPLLLGYWCASND